MNLKFAPDLRFRRDDSFDEAARIDALLRSEKVQRDLAKPAGRARTTEPMSDPKAPAPDKREPRPKKREVNGWLVLDKGVGMTSTHAVAVVKRGLQRQEGGPCRHPRSARLRHPADRARRGDQDRAVRHGRAQILRLHRRLGRRDRHRRCRGPAGPGDRIAAPSAPRSRRCCRASPARSSRCRRASRRSRSRASAPTISPARARRSSCSRARSRSTGSR